MNIPQRTPPPLRRPPTMRTLTPLQEIEAWSWFCAKRHLGTFKTKAREMGVSPWVLEAACRRMLEREQDEIERVPKRGCL